jgi:hypothetical protein
MREGRSTSGQLFGAPAVVAAAALVTAFRLCVGVFFDTVSVASGNGGLAPLVFGGDDGVYYRQAAVSISYGIPQPVPNPFPRIIGEVMALTGIRSLYPYKWAGIFASILCIVYAGRVASRLTSANSTAVRRVILCLGLLPTAAYYSSYSFTRDVWIVCLFLVASLVIAIIVHRGRAGPGQLLLFGTMFISTASLRPYASLSMILGVGVYFLAISSLRKPVRVLLMIGSLLGALFLKGRILAQLQTLSEFRQAYSGGGSSVGLTLIEGGPLQRIASYFYSLTFNVIGPLPWQARSPVLLFAFVFDSIPCVIALTLIIRRRRNLAQWAKMLLAIAGTYLSLISIFNDNIGAAGRLRLPATCLLLFVAATLTPAPRRSIRSARPLLSKTVSEST